MIHFPVICYLATFALDDLGLRNFTKIVKSLDIKNIELVRHMFLIVHQLLLLLPGFSKKIL